LNIVNSEEFTSAEHSIYLLKFSQYRTIHTQGNTHVQLSSGMK